MSKYWLMVLALSEEPVRQKLNNYQREFVDNLKINLDPNDPEAELGSKAKKWIVWLYQEFVVNINGQWEEI